MLTVLEAINKSTEYFTKKNIESPRTNAELLLADILNCKRLDLYLMFDRPLDQRQVDAYRDFIARRGGREPLQYITGKVEFYGLNFHVDRNVLIPRQETEILVETILNDHSGIENLKIFDIGTGSGNIPVCLAKHLSSPAITSIDKSRGALSVAASNLKLNEVESKVKLIEMDLFDLTPEKLSQRFDIVVSNPPYVSSKEYEELQAEITGHEPAVAVTDNSSGYTFYERISKLGLDLLVAGGKLYFEAGQGQAREIERILVDTGYQNIRSVKDYLDIDRVVIGEKL